MPSTTKRAGWPSGPRGVPRCGLELPPRRPQGRLQDRVGHEGDLRGDGPQALLADDVAVGDAERFAAFEPPQRPQHGRLVLQGGDLRHQLVDQRLPRHRLPLGQPQQVEPFRVDHQQVAEVLAGGEDLQQRGQGLRIALEERAHRQAGSAPPARTAPGCAGPCRDRRSRASAVRVGSHMHGQQVQRSRRPWPCPAGSRAPAARRRSPARRATRPRRRSRRGIGGAWRCS